MIALLLKGSSLNVLAAILVVVVVLPLIGFLIWAWSKRRSKHSVGGIFDE